MRFLAAPLCSTFLLAQGLLAQAKPDPLRYVPSDADVVAHTVGAAAWQRDLGATRLGKALADPQLWPVWKKLLAFVQTKVMFDGKQQQLGQVTAIWDALKDYSGEVAFGVRSDWDSIENLDDWSGAAVVALGGDGKADLEKLVELVGDMLPGEVENEVEIDGIAAPLRNIGKGQVLGPILHDGHFVMLFGLDLEKRTGWFFGEAADPVANKDVREPTIALRVRLGRAMHAIVATMEQGGGLPGQFLAELGLLSIDEMLFTLYPDGKYVGQQIQMKFGDKPRGLIAVGCPERATQPGLLHYLPAGAGTYAAAPMDIGALQKIYEDFFAKHGGDLPMSREDLESGFSDMTNLDLLKDVFAHIGDEYMRIDDMSADLDYDEDESEQVQKAKEKLSEACFVIKLKNGRAIGKNLDTAIRARGLHVGRKREDYNGTNVYRMNLLGMFPIEYAVTDSLLLVGVGDGEGTKENLRGVLDAVAAAAGGAVPAFAPEVTERINGMQAGWGGIQVGSLVDMLDGLVAAGESLDAMLTEEGMSLDDIEDPWQLIMDASKALKSVLARHQAGVIVNLDYFETDRYVMRSRW